MKSSAHERHIWIPALVFTAISLIFLFSAFWFQPRLTEDQRKIVNFVFAFVAGMSTAFLGGGALLKIFGKIGTYQVAFSAVSGVAVFVFVYINPLFGSSKQSSDSHGHPIPTWANARDIEVMELQDQVTDLRAETGNLDYEESRTKLKTGENIARKLLLRKDDDIHARFRFIRDEYAAIGLTRAARAWWYERNPEQTVRVAELAVQSADHFSALYVHAKNVGGDADENQAVRWVDDDEGAERTMYQKAVAQCLAAQIQKDSASMRRAKETYERIAASYRSSYPGTSGPELKPCLETTPDGEAK